MVDALGNPVGFFLSGGQAHDLVGADHLLPSMEADQLRPTRRSTLTSGSGHRWPEPARPPSFQPRRTDARTALSTATSTRRAISSRTSSLSSSSSGPSQPGMTRPHETSSPASTSQAQLSGSIDDRP